MSRNLGVGQNSSSPNAAASGLHRTAVICLVLLGICAAPAGAQVASYLDVTGKRVFINTAPPAPKKPDPVAAKPETGKEAAIPAPAPTPSVVKVPAKHPKENLERMINETAERHRVDPNLVKAVVQAESGYDPFAVSRKGAQGLMQLVPGTATQLGVKNVFDPQQNLDAGVGYLRTLLERYNGDLPKALAAYNAGATSVDRWGGVPNFRETRLYVQKITNSYFRPGYNSSVFGGFAKPKIHRMVDDRGRVVFTNE